MEHIDYIVAAAPFLLFLISVIAGKVRGLAGIVLSAVFVIAFMIIARRYVPDAAVMLNDKFIHRRFVEYLSSVISKSISEGGGSLYDSLPSYLRELLREAGISAGNLVSSAGAAGISEKIAPPLERSIVIPAVKSALYVLAYIFARIAGAVASAVTGIVTRLPVIKQVNGFLGAVLGGITGIILAALSVLLMFAVAGFIPETEFARAVNDSAVLNSMNEIIQSII